MISFRPPVLSALILALSAVSGAGQEEPNIVFFLADDLGLHDMTGEGSTFHETPNIDRIAAEGVRFSNGYATCQVCSPSRASLMTGKYPVRFPITDWINSGGGGQPENWKRNTARLPAAHVLALPLEEVTLAEALKGAGYQTMFAGKWHLGGEGFYPEDQGFDVNKGGHERGSPPGGFFSPYKNPKLEDGPVGESLPIRLGEEVASFIEGAAAEDGPFFTYLSFYSVHGPDQTTHELYSKYREKALALGVEEGTRFAIDGRVPIRQVQDHPIYGGMMESMDDAVGIVLAKLDALGLAENTIVIFTSDNGGVSAGDAFSTSNLPLRGGKGIEFEGGVKEPYYIRWPAVAKPGVCEVPVTGTDFFPTLLEAAGVDVAEVAGEIDGVSLMAALKGDEGFERGPLYWHYPHYSNQGGEPAAMIRDGEWKVIENLETGAVSLYHLGDDGAETTDLAAEKPEVAARLAGMLDAWQEETGARGMDENPRFDEEAFAKAMGEGRENRRRSLEQFHHRLVHPSSEPPEDQPVTYGFEGFKK